MGIISLPLCIIPLPLGIVPVVLGIVGLRKRAANPVIKGSVHAWIGIVTGAISALFSIFFLSMIVVGVLADRR